MNCNQWQQLKSILWKNWLLKKAQLWGTIAELMLPVLFMALLILIKSITTKYESPNIAFFCGQAFPWSYSSQILTPFEYPFTCQLKPDTCTQSNYYQNQVNEPGFSFYTQYGYVQSGASTVASNPFYTYTIADNSSIYTSGGNFQWMTNPSLPFNDIINRLAAYRAVLAVAPGDGASQQLIEQAQNLTSYLQAQCVSSASAQQAIVYFSSESSLEDYVTDSNYENLDYGVGKIALGIVLYAADVPSAQWDYAVRGNYTPNYDTGEDTVACLTGPNFGNDSSFVPSYSSCWYTYGLPSTKFYTQDLYKPQSVGNMYGYTYTGFSTIQETVDKFIFSNYLSPTQANELEVQASFSPMPTSAFNSDDFQYVISSTLGLFYMLSFLYPVSRIVRALVIEKETRVKEGMKMMGLTDSVYNLSWLITTLIQMTLVSILITLVTGGTVFEYSNKVLVFIYFEVFSLAVINMCFLMATFFSRSKVASFIGPMIFFGSFFPYYSANNPQFSTSTKTSTCLLAPSCFALGANVFADYEGGLVGVQPDNAALLTSNFSYNLCVGMLFVDAVLYGILAWYFDKVLPSEFGTPLPFYFPFLPSYWLGFHVDFWSFFSPSSSSSSLDLSSPLMKPSSSSDNNNQPSLVVSSAASSASSSSGTGYRTNHNNNHNHTHHSVLRQEPVSQELKKQEEDGTCVSIRGLRKVYPTPGEERVAVKGLDLNLYEGQVSVLLGHNGAGKSTTISMLVGLTPPSAGTASLRGLNLNTDLQQIRQKLGVCPQHDILFPDLTVLQHLQMFAAFKGVPSSENLNAAKQMISEVGLLEKASAKAGTLSGGQKRKLSLGIALIGGSEIVILDEPTSGMDPYSRRSTWSIIQRNKKGRVILLTTHFMDEADILGDRIAIMAQGKLQCVGSSLFLKGIYGVGYTLTIVKSSQSQPSSLLNSLVVDCIPAAEPLSDVGAEQSFRLPFSASHLFVSLFSKLDAMKETGNLAEYGVSVTTLEEVFIKVGEGVEENEDIQSTGRPSASGRDSVQFPSLVSSALTLSSSPQLEYKDNENDDEEVGVTSSSSGKEMGIALRTPSKASQDHASKSQLNNNNHGSDHDQLDVFSNVNSFQVFWWHFIALLQKRIIYGKRDQRMFICQMLIPVVLVIVGLCILLIIPSIDQPDLILNPNYYNPTLSHENQNYVPIYVSSDAIPLGSRPSNMSYDIASRFNGQSVWGVGVQVNSDTLYTTEDAFDSCADGSSTLHNFSNYLLNVDQPSSEQGSSRYGSLVLSDLTNGSRLVYNALINASAVHGAGVYMNLVHQAYLQVLTGIESASITAHNYPLPPTYKENIQASTGNTFVTATFCIIAFCFIPASFATFVVKEREVKAKHQQIISGVSIYAYWCSTFLWDCFSFFPTAAFVIAIFYAFSIDGYTSGGAAGAVACLLVLFGPAVAAMTYMISFLFSSHSTAQIMIMFFNFLTGLCLMVVSFVLTTIPSTSALNLQLRYFFRLFPSFCLGDGLLQLALCANGQTCPTINAQGYDYMQTQGPYAWDIAGGNITFLVVEAVVYFIITILIEYLLTFPSLLSFLSYVQDDGVDQTLLETEDIDVKDERDRVARGDANDSVVRLQELRKVYRTQSIFSLVYSYFCPPPPDRSLPTAATPSASSSSVNKKVAVQSLSFGIPKGECFGFLGINGAGKTTTLSILSGEFPPTSGSAFISGQDIQQDQALIRRKIGYCPQFDALLELLTVREHLELYARIKGMRGSLLVETVESKLSELDLRDFENKLAGSLSGGNKRKLSVAIATIGNPSIVFLDEPSTGMDPVARRFMWSVISTMSTQRGENGCSIILTTHSMEEAEALCTRIGVMVNGQLRCLGSSQHLKERFGRGYEVNVRTKMINNEWLVKYLCVLVLSLQSQPQQLASLSHPLQPIVDQLKKEEQINHQLSPFNYLLAFASSSSSSSILPSLSDMDPLSSLLEQCLVNQSDLLPLFTQLTNTFTPSPASSSSTSSSELKFSVDSVLAQSRLAQISPQGSASSLYFAMRGDGGAVRGLSLKAILDWWISEESASSLSTFMSSSFGPLAQLLERSSAHNFRYRICRPEDVDQHDTSPIPSSSSIPSPLLRGEDSAVSSSSSSSSTSSVSSGTLLPSLSSVFELFETNKQSLQIQEYSVGQTTLEQIFNQFASSQDNPEVARAQQQQQSTQQ